MIRTRKGLITNKKIVEDGHKNKTISKNKWILFIKNKFNQKYI